MLTFRLNIALLLSFVFAVASCDLQDALDKQPHDAVSDDQALETVDDLERATQGNYAIIISEGGWPIHHEFPRTQHEFGEYSGDNIMLSGSTTDNLWDIHTYTSASDQGHVQQFWESSYKVIYGANQVLNADVEAETQEEEERLDQVMGENLFLRAFMHFNLANVYGRPYSHGEENLAVPYINVPGVEVDNPERNTIGEVYDEIIDDLERSKDLLNAQRPSAYPSREAVDAFLSRLYLYMEDNQQAIEYANNVINSGRYELLSTEDFTEFPTWEPEESDETIYAIKQTRDDMHTSIATMYYTSPGGDGWGEIYASEEYRNLLHEDDVRSEWIQPDLDEDGNIIERNDYPKYFITKHSYQNGNPLVSSPVQWRLAEMYLNRAEANAKLGNDQDAIDDVNLIRERAGLDDQLYEVGDLGDHDTVLNVVLEERRLELAFEAQRYYDLVRNNRPVERDFPGVHRDVADATVIEPDDYRHAQPLPETELELNPNLQQNDGY